MSRWKELPAQLHPHVHGLIVRLRKLKDRSELSTHQLAAKTGYSARSWQRYLNGRSLPPREAVEAMARIGGDDPTRLLVLHDIAAERWTEGHAAAGCDPESTLATPVHTPAEQQPYERYRHTAVTAGAVALMLSVSAALLLAVRHADARTRLAEDRSGLVAAVPVTASESSAPVGGACRWQQRNGRWYAGHSRTFGSVLAYAHSGPEVAEAQCLLHRAGAAPGDIDGVFGRQTQRAVERVQAREGLAVDGVLDPRTWKALREAAPK
ncbi:peptidoglycan-binding protein [Streptomyces sp. NPDC053499]|uniref:peptidoglycan-binding protein n=1 Tax=Streptomyces sp. NPDC053499 TaxID=3365707 RepID=UPI0037D711BA